MQNHMLAHKGAFDPEDAELIQKGPKLTAKGADLTQKGANLTHFSMKKGTDFTQ